MNRKGKILEVALRLFSEEGYKATSTSRIAREAEVSEGLIFRHFGTKEKLVQAVLETADYKIEKMVFDISKQKHAEKILKAILEIPFTTTETEFEFWKLQFKLKWELGHHRLDKIRPLKELLTNTFQQLNYASPKSEAQFVLIYLEGVASYKIHNMLEEQESFLKLILKKYNLT